MTSDLELLRRHEPVVRYTQGELFLPSPVEPYIEQCSLWARQPGRRTAELVPAGELDTERLVDEAGKAQWPLSLRFVQQPLHGREYAGWRKTRPPFQGSGRLARVGLGPRFVDSLFSLSLLLRGRVPGGTTGRASIQYDSYRAANPLPYYGRVVRSEGYVVLQYLFFYAMNDWRSTFRGVNDHEADWEQMFIYLDEVDGGEPQPAWVACAAHDYFGDDLRRRWDDPELTIADGHPVVFAGAGSHATYFKPGEYLTSVELKMLRPVANGVYALRRLWRNVLGQGDPETLVRQVEALVHVPFVDYARGDGHSVGPGQEFEWTPRVISDEVDWVFGYRGLWGLDTEDIFAGELAPAGPRYTREGMVRQSWYDPLGWAGLSKVAPPSRTEVTLEQRLEQLAEEVRDTQERAGALRQSLRKVEIEARRLAPQAAAGARQAALTEEMRTGETELNDLEAATQGMRREMEVLRREQERLRNGDRGDPRAHIRHSHEPAPPGAARRGRLAEFWATVSVGVLLLAAAAIIWFTSTDVVVGLIALLGGAVLVDNILRGTLRPLLLNVTIVLALITTGVLVYEFAWQIALGLLAAIGAIILLQNLRKLERW